jgi:hypothetical protein
MLVGAGDLDLIEMCTLLHHLSPIPMVDSSPLQLGENAVHEVHRDGPFTYRRGHTFHIA